MNFEGRSTFKRKWKRFGSLAFKIWMKIITKHMFWVPLRLVGNLFWTVILLKNIFEFGFNMGLISFIQGKLVEDNRWPDPTYWTVLHLLGRLGSHLFAEVGRHPSWSHHSACGSPHRNEYHQIPSSNLGGTYSSFSLLFCFFLFIYFFFLVNVVLFCFFI